MYRKDRMQFIIDRSKWRCGRNGINQRGKGGILLLNEQGYMCCLGQISCQLNMKKKQILNKATPNHIGQYISILTSKRDYGIVNSVLSKKAVLINDDPNLTDQERERKLSSLFSKWKHKLTFKGKYG